jgi:hypothetical protein
MVIIYSDELIAAPECEVWESDIFQVSTRINPATTRNADLVTSEGEERMMADQVSNHEHSKYIEQEETHHQCS